MSGSRPITGDSDRLDNVHPGDILREDYLIGSEISVEEVAEGAGLDMDQLGAIISGQQSVDANVDIRLARYFSGFRSTMIWKKCAAPAVPNWTRSAREPPDLGWRLPFRPTAF